MTYPISVLLICVVANVLVSCVLKFTKASGYKLEIMIAMNYWCAMLFVWLINRPNPAVLLEQSSSVYLISGLLGFLLPSSFYVMGKAVETAGIVRADATTRLSLILTLIAAFFIFKDQTALIQNVGIALAFLALFFLSAKPAGSEQEKNSGFWLFAVWAMYGICDTLFKVISSLKGDFTSCLSLAFTLAAIIMTTRLLLARAIWNRKVMLWGCLLGLLNFINIYTYILAHQLFTSPALVFISSNIGMIAVATILGPLFFKEKPSKLEMLGVALSIVAIVFLYLPLWQ